MQLFPAPSQTEIPRTSRRDASAAALGKPEPSCKSGEQEPTEDPNRDSLQSAFHATVAQSVAEDRAAAHSETVESATPPTEVVQGARQSLTDAVLQTDHATDSLLDVVGSQDLDSLDIFESSALTEASEASQLLADIVESAEVATPSGEEADPLSQLQSSGAVDAEPEGKVAFDLLRSTQDRNAAPQFKAVVADEPTVATIPKPATLAQ